MKRNVWLLAALLCSAILLFAGDKNNSKQMTGWVCNAKCVDQSSGTATCNQSCSESSGSVVFIDQNGRVLHISNQEMATPMSGKRCKINAKMDPSSGMIAVQNIEEYAGP